MWCFVILLIDWGEECALSSFGDLYWKSSVMGSASTKFGTAANSNPLRGVSDEGETLDTDGKMPESVKPVTSMLR